MTKAWEFRHLDFIYMAAAADVDAARLLVAKYDPAAAKEKPKHLPNSIVKFFRMKEGSVVTSKVYNTGQR